MKKLIKEKEASLESRLGAKIKSMGGWSLKLLPTFVIGLPDRMCLLPGGRIFFAEIKTTGEKPRRSQLLVHRKLEEMGFKVYVIDSSKQMDQILADWREPIKAIDFLKEKGFEDSAVWNVKRDCTENVSQFMDDFKRRS